MDMIIIPMAGKSLRFITAGYTKPKWMLPIHGRPLLDYVINSFKLYIKTDHFVFIFMSEPGFEEFITERAECLGLNKYTLIAIEVQTQGQAETVYKGLKRVQIEPSEEVIIFNADTIRPNFKKPNFLENCDGWIECFLGSGEHWSFVEADTLSGENLAIRVVEKKRISNLCSTGIYFFKNPQIFYDAYRLELKNRQANELYVAPLYQNIINQGRIVRFNIISSNEIYFSGIPAEYLMSCKEKNLINFFE